MRRFVRPILISVAVMLAVSGGFLAYYIPTLSPRLKRRAISALERRFDADVELRALQVSIFPLPSVDGEGLEISQKGHLPGDQPMIKIRHFRARTGVTTLLDWRNLVDEVTLDGLEIHVPRPANRPRMSGNPQKDETQLKFVIRTIVASQALLEVEPKPGKDPLSFPVESLIMHSVGQGRAMEFTARLRNAKPPGDIDTSGHFGPWVRDDPRSTPVSGDYTFQHADLSVFKGISGTLSSTGRYGGVLQRIQVRGETDTPNFALQKGGHAVHLTTRFHSIVDGTDGDTILNPVDARFGKSEFICNGSVARKGTEPGKTVELQADATRARIEDILALVVVGTPIIRGSMDFKSTILIPPGAQPVVEKLNLNGQFYLTSATFTNPQTAARLRTLSNRASGISKQEEQQGKGAQESVASNLSARFVLQSGVVFLSQLSFEVPGSRIQMNGQYNLVSSGLDMKGLFQMKATLSETQSGFKALLLKPFNRYFEKNGAGFEMPFTITGTREHPTIGAEAFHKTFSIH